MKLKHGATKILASIVLGIMVWVAAIPCVWLNGGSTVSAFSNTVIIQNTISTDNGTRYYNLYVPSDLPSSGVPLLIVLHGGTGGCTEVLGITSDGTDNLTNSKPFKTFLYLADYEKFIVVAPQGTNDVGKTGNNWNDGRTNDYTRNWSSQNHIDDVGFISKLIDTLKANYPCIDTNKIYATGTSNGAMMSFRLAQELSNKVAAIAISNGNKPDPDEYGNGYPPHQVAVLMVHGTTDPIMPPNGGTIYPNTGTVTSVANTVNYWLGANNLTGVTPVNYNFPDGPFSDNNTTASKATYSLPGNAPVCEYTITNGGHTPPSILQQTPIANRRLTGNQNCDIEFAHEVWAFLRTNGLNGAITPIAPATYRPGNYTLESGTRAGGVLEFMDYRDYQYLDIGSAVSPSVICDYVLEQASPTSIILTVVSKDSQDSGNKSNLYLYNYATNAWDLKKSDDVTTSDLTQTFTVNTGLANYINAAKQVRFKIVHARTDSTGHDMYIDQAVLSFPAVNVPVGSSTGSANSNLGAVDFSASAGLITGLTNITQPNFTFGVGGYSFPYGMFSYNINNLRAGQSVTITIHFPNPLPLGVKYYKYQNGNLIDCSSIMTRIDLYTLQLNLTDGGLGDADGIANGTIVDPGGPAFPLNAPTSHGASTPSVPQSPVLLSNISVKSASLSATRIAPGTPVTVISDVANNGAMKGTKKVKVYVNGQLDSEQGVMVGSGSSSQLTFFVVRSEPGEYNVNVDGVSAGSFKVELIEESDMVLIISSILLIMAFVLGMVMIGRKQQRNS